ncbi:hypothetical protein MPH_04087 [Macrophomina phaseolina MS6]|uniref:Uncharacterized protein n=1 Tax=Macrophomina phaseolina (strain MS6) TaxID=1126212 RepID=K2S887_MACPH|nr:hypothetical protein MPH_04087 [Macrophomina phaseolina MS6]
MPPEIAEAFGRQAERRAGTFQPWSFLGSQSAAYADPSEAAGSPTDYPSGPGESAISMSGFSPPEHSPSSMRFGDAHTPSMTPSTLQGWTNMDPLYGREPAIHVNPHHGPTLRMPGASELGPSRHLAGSTDFSSLDPRFYSPDPMTYTESAGENVGTMHGADTVLNSGSRSFEVESMHNIGCHPHDMNSMPDTESMNDTGSMPATSSYPEIPGSMHNIGSQPYEMGSMYAMASMHGMGTHGMGSMHSMGNMHSTDALSYSQSAAPVFGGLSQFNDSSLSGLPPSFTPQLSTELGYGQGDSPMPGLLLGADGDADEEDGADEKHASEGYVKHQRGEGREVAADSQQRISSRSAPPWSRSDDAPLSSNNHRPPKKLRVDGRGSNIGSLPDQYSMSREPLSVSLTFVANATCF